MKLIFLFCFYFLCVNLKAQIHEDYFYLSCSNSTIFFQANVTDKNYNEKKELLINSCEFIKNKNSNDKVIIYLEFKNDQIINDEYTLQYYKNTENSISSFIRDENEEKYDYTLHFKIKESTRMNLIELLILIDYSLTNELDENNTYSIKKCNNSNCFCINLGINE
ncbi:hypothetical protein [Empedobacter falsenii]